VGAAALVGAERVGVEVDGFDASRHLRELVQPIAPQGHTQTYSHSLLAPVLARATTARANFPACPWQTVISIKEIACWHDYKAVYGFDRILYRQHRMYVEGYPPIAGASHVTRLQPCDAQQQL
jgi:hypothetical protein